MKKKTVAKKKAVSRSVATNNNTLQEALESLSESTINLQKKKLKSAEYKEQFVFQVSGSNAGK